MSKLFSAIDLFGTSFTFTTFSNKQFKTSAGGMLTLICGIITCIFTFFFGSNFFYRKNPTIVSQTISPTDYLPPIDLTIEKFPIAWRLEDLANNFVNFTGTIFPIITYYNYIANSEGDLVLNQTQTMQTKLCSELNITNKQFFESINPNKWYCLDWSENDFNFGGYWDGSYADYVKIILYYCPKGSNYQNGIGCTSLDDFIAKANSANPWYFSVMYPESYFNPNILNNPLQVSYRNYYYGFDPYLRKTDRIFFNQIFSIDDKGWIFEDVYNSTELSYLEIQSDFNYFGGDKYATPGINTGFYTCYFYMSKSYQSFNRSYQKIQDLLAVVGGFLKMVFIAGEVLSFLISDHYRNEYLSNELFKLQKPDKIYVKK